MIKIFEKNLFFIALLLTSACIQGSKNTEMGAKITGGIKPEIRFIGKDGKISNLQLKTPKFNNINNQLSANNTENNDSQQNSFNNSNAFTVANNQAQNIIGTKTSPFGDQYYNLGGDDHAKNSSLNQDKDKNQPIAEIIQDQQNINQKLPQTKSFKPKQDVSYEIISNTMVQQNKPISNFVNSKENSQHKRQQDLSIENEVNYSSKKAKNASTNNDQLSTEIISKKVFNFPGKKTIISNKRNVEMDSSKLKTAAQSNQNKLEKTFIQIGSFSNKINARKAIEKAKESLKEKFQSAKIKEFINNGEKSYKALVGPVSSQEKIDIMVEELEKNNMDVIVFKE
jgi:hypothetical protein